MNNNTVISMHKTGGFAGMHFSYEIKFKSLDEKLRKRLEILIEDSGMMDAVETKKKNEHARDIFQYSFSLKADGEFHRALFDDMTLPDSYRKIADFLKEFGVETE